MAKIGSSGFEIWYFMKIKHALSHFPSHCVVSMVISGVQYYFWDFVSLADCRCGPQ